MNRAQRRAAVKKGLTANELGSALKHEGLSATRQAVDLYSVAVAYTLYNKLGFGKKKILMTMKQIEDLFDSVNGDYVTFEDMKQVLLDEIGLNFCR